MADPTTDDPLLSLGHEDVAATSNWPPVEWGFTPPAQTQPGTGIPAAAFDAAAQTLGQPAAPPLADVPSRLGAPGFGPIPEAALDNATDHPTPPPLVDAVTGAAPIALQATSALPPRAPELAPQDQAAPAPPPLGPDGQPLPQPFGPGGEPRIEAQPSDVALAKKHAGLTDEQIAAEDEKSRELAAYEANTKRRDEVVANEQRSLAQYGFHQQAQTSALKEMDDNRAKLDALAQQRIDPDRWWNSRSTGQRIAGFVAAIAGGLAAPSMGGRNIGLEQLNKEIDRDIDAQKENLGNQRSLFGMRMQNTQQRMGLEGDRFRDEQLFRIASYDQVMKQIDVEQQLYDPRGTIARHYEMTKRQVAAARSAALQKLDEQAVKSQLEVAKFRLDAYDKEQAQKAKQQEIGLRGWEIAEQAKGRSDALQMHHDEMEQKRLDREAAKEAAAAAKEGDGTIGGVVSGVDAQGNVQYSKLTNSDGKPFVIKDKEVHAKVTNMLTGADEVNRLTNQLAREIKEWGGQPNFSGKGQKLNADKEALVFALHQAEKIEGFRPGTAEMLEDLTGGVSTTSWIKTATPGLLRGRDNINALANASLRRAGYTGPAYAPADTSALPEPKNDEIDELGAAISRDVRELPPEQLSADDNNFIRGSANNDEAEAGRGGYARGLALANPDDLNAQQRAYLESVDPKLVTAWRSGFSPSQLDAFAQLADVAKSKDATKDAGGKTRANRATEILRDLVDHGPMASRQMAARALADQATSSLPTPETDLGDMPDVSPTQHVEAPPAPPRKAKEK